MTSLVIARAGWGTSIQDDGRPGYGALGVPVSGALDGRMHQLLNRLLGNVEGAAVLETLGGLVVRVSGPALVATSAELATTMVAAGEEVGIEPASGDLWGYLAVRGGLDVPMVLGSRSTDSRSGLGPARVVEGTVLPIGRDPGTPIVVDQAPRAAPGERVAGLRPGPRADWFVSDTLDVLASSTWTVSADASRVGVRLDGPALRRRLTQELPSEGVIPGAVQVPPDGRPVVMLADHPTTGGYPVIAVVDPASLATVAQCRPGTELRFRLLP